jgi:hypothetical protein
MDVVIRLFLRFILVPLGASLAVAIAAAVVVIAHWNAIVAVMSADPVAQQYYFMALIFAGPVLAILLAAWAIYMFVPAAIGVLIAETFAIRSWLYHAANGGISAWVGWAVSQDIDAQYRFLSEPKILVAAGLAAGLTYWLVAGWTAGFWRPIRSPRPVEPRK